MIKDILQKLDFNEKEIDLYLAILQRGKITPADLAKITGINRTTVYSVTKELVKKGVVAEDLGSEIMYLVALPPQDLNLVIKKEEKKLAEKKDLVAKAMSELNSFAKNTKYAVPKIVYIAEEDLENYLYKQSSVWNESLMKYDGCWWGFQDASFVQYYEKWIDWYWQDGSPKAMQLKLLSNTSAETAKKKKYPNRQIKIWQDGKDFTATVWINGDYVIMIVTGQSPRYLVEIHDSVLAHNMREFYKGVWKTIK